MQKLLPVYRVLAYVVGVLITLLYLGMLMKYGASEGSSIQDFGQTFTPVVAVGHGWVYMAYLVVAFLLARRERWSIGFSLTMLVAGLVPLLMFWVERQVEKKVAAATAAVG